MTSSITYTNYLQEPVNKEEFDALDNKCIVYTETGLVKKIERINHDCVYHITYYLGGNETTNSVLAMFDGLDVDIVTRSVVDDYTLEESSGYNVARELTFLFKELYDTSGNLICSQDYDLASKLPIAKSTDKYLFDNPDEMWVLWFNYNDDGSFKSICGNWVDNTDQGRKGSIYNDKLSLYFPTLLTDFPYYKNSDILPPPAGL